MQAVLFLVALFIAPGLCSSRREISKTHSEMHKQLEKALISDPLNLYQLEETYFPRNSLVVTVSAEANFTIICQPNCQRDGLIDCTHGNETTFYWTSVSMEPERMDPVTFAILSNSFQKEHFGTATPFLDLELALCNEEIPKEMTRETFKQELKKIAHMVRFALKMGSS